jgi:hypothetical protein
MRCAGAVELLGLGQTNDYKVATRLRDNDRSSEASQDPDVTSRKISRCKIRGVAQTVPDNQVRILTSMAGLR